MKIKITDIHPEDAFYDDRERLIGKEGTIERPLKVWDDNGCSYGSVLISDLDSNWEHGNPVMFHAIKYEVLSTQSPEK